MMPDTNPYRLAGGSFFPDVEGAPRTGRASLRRLLPSGRVRVVREGEFLVRVLAMAGLAGGSGGLIMLVPGWPSKFWLEGMLLGFSLSLAATLVTDRPGSLGKLALGAIFGVAMLALTSAGYPFSGLAVFGAGIGLLAASGKAGLYAMGYIAIFSAYSAILGAWAAYALGETLHEFLPVSLAAAVQWSVLGFFISLGSIPMHLTLRADPVLKYVRGIRRKLKKVYLVELDGLIDRYLSLKRPALSPEADGFDDYLNRKTKLEEALLVCAESSRALQALDLALAGASEKALKSRERQLREQCAIVSDPVARARVEKKLSEVYESLACRRRLLLERERLTLALFRADGPLGAGRAIV